jgi:hypothetical protein
LKALKTEPIDNHAEAMYLADKYLEIVVAVAEWKMTDEANQGKEEVKTASEIEQKEGT